MSSSPNSSLHPATDPDTELNTKGASSFPNPNSSLQTISTDIPSYGAMHDRDSGNNDKRPKDPTPAPETTAETTPANITALQIAEDRHAREIQALEERHRRDLERVREELKRVHAAEIKDVKMALYAEHRRDLLELKEEKERGLDRLRTFFAAITAPGTSSATGEILRPSRVPARAEAASPAAAPAPTASSSTATAADTTTITTATSPTSTPGSNPTPAAPHLRFLTTGITPKEARRKVAGADGK